LHLTKLVGLHLHVEWPQLSAFGHHQLMRSERNECAGALAVAATQEDEPRLILLQASCDSVSGICVATFRHQQQHDVRPLSSRTNEFEGQAARLMMVKFQT
jgi:hypothetical protein